MLRLNTMKLQPGANQDTKRVGRGAGSGRGTTAGKGEKGQKARSGRGNLRIGFEGGQTPLYRRVPKRGFTNFHRRPWVTLNVGEFDILRNTPKEISLETLKSSNRVSKSADRLVILGTGEVKKAYKVTAHKITDSAKEKITKAGGSVELLALPQAVNTQAKRKAK